MRSLFVLCLWALTSWAQVPATPAPAAASSAVEIPFERYALPNGLEVLLHEDHRLPVVAVNLWYHVGAYHERPGRSGFAHLFEHMMFQGSKHVGDDIHIRLLEEIGATDLNGSTNFDRTNYYQTVPSHHLETALWLESDRMGFLLPSLTPAKLANQQEVVKNERRQRTETAPYGIARERVWKALFPEPHPYNGVVIGSMADLEAATLADVKDFFRTWYAPSNATLVIAGDFDPAKAKALVEKYFATLPSPPKPTSPAVKDVAIEKPVMIEHDEPIARQALLSLSWLSPEIFSGDDAVGDLLSDVLSSGKSSRLYERLVHQKQLATSVNAYHYGLQAQSLFGIQAVAAPGVSTQTLLQEIDAVLAEVRTKGVEQSEITRALNRLQTSTVSSLQSPGGKAEQLQYYNHYLGEPDYLAKDLARYEAVVPAQLQRYAQAILDPNKRVILHAVPGAAKAAPTPPPSPSSKEAR